MYFNSDFYSDFGWGEGDLGNAFIPPLTHPGTQKYSLAQFFLGVGGGIEGFKGTKVDGGTLKHSRNFFWVGGY